MKFKSQARLLVLSCPTSQASHPEPNFHQVISCCYIPILPSSPLAVMFTGRLAVMIFTTDKHFGLVGFGHGGLEGNITFIHTVHETCFCGIVTNDLERM